MISKQETFDTVAKFLLKQGGPAFDPIQRNCYYKTSDGKKCAAGCLISDKEYDPIMEHYPNVLNKGPVKDLLESKGYNLIFVRGLQQIHDRYDSSENWNKWIEDMINFANNHELSIEVFNDYIN